MASFKRKDGRQGELSPLFIKKVWSTLRTACNKARKLRLIVTNPCDFVDPPKVERKEMHALSPSQVGQYLAAFDSTDLGTAVAVAIGSGCRRGELLALRWCDVDLERGTLRVERSLEPVTVATQNASATNSALRNPRANARAGLFRSRRSPSNAYGGIASNRRNGSWRPVSARRRYARIR